jgi:tetratricopeptide (TPR) repeat protein
LAPGARFEKVAREYRAKPVKPALPEEARKYKVQAEFAVEQKRFPKAVQLYEQALELAPWWPDGHFNRALILGETGRYPEAISAMKKYLALEPEASDARAAQDKIYQWESVLPE